jgi:hypothetical protein
MHAFVLLLPACRPNVRQPLYDSMYAACGASTKSTLQPEAATAAAWLQQHGCLTAALRYASRGPLTLHQQHPQLHLPCRHWQHQQHPALPVGLRLGPVLKLQHHTEADKMLALLLSGKLQ